MNIKNLLDNKIIPVIELESQSIGFLKIYKATLFRVIQAEGRNCTCNALYPYIGINKVTHQIDCRIDINWVDNCIDIYRDIIELLPTSKPKGDGYIERIHDMWHLRPSVHICWDCRISQKRTTAICPQCNLNMQPIPYYAKMPSPKHLAKWKQFEKEYRK